MNNKKMYDKNTSFKILYLNNFIYNFIFKKTAVKAFLHNKLQ